MPESRRLAPALPRGTPLVQVAGYARNRVCMLSSHAVALDESLCSSAHRGHQQAQTQHNCWRANRTGQICAKTSFLPCCTDITEYPHFSKSYMILNDLEEHWYYSCYVLGSIANVPISWGLIEGCLPVLCCNGDESCHTKLRVDASCSRLWA